MVDCGSFLERFYNEPEHYLEPFIAWLKRRNYIIIDKKDFIFALKEYYNLTNVGSYVWDCIEQSGLENEFFSYFEKMFKEEREIKELEKEKKKFKEREILKEKEKVKAMKTLRKIKHKEYVRKMGKKEIKVKSYERTYTKWTLKERLLLINLMKEQLSSREIYNRFVSAGYSKTHSAVKTRLSRIKKANKVVKNE